MKKIYILLVSFLLIIPSYWIGDIVSPSQVDKVNPKDSFYDESESLYGDNTTSFHGITSGNNANWYVVKFSMPLNSHLEELYIKLAWKCKEARGDTSGFALTNLTETYYWWFHWFRYNRSDFFIHTNIGPFNYTYDHLEKYNYSSFTEFWIRGPKSPFYNLSSGTWYLICLAAETVECKIEVWINTTMETSFSTTEGNTSFLISTEELGGYLNFKIPHAIGILNGRMTISINNTFFGSWTFPMAWGGGRILLEGPDGKLKKCIFILSEHLTLGWTSIPHFFIGESGLYKFRVDMLAVSRPREGYYDPWFFRLYGADIKLP
jgi:hypothetical protein